MARKAKGSSQRPPLLVLGHVSGALSNKSSFGLSSSKRPSRPSSGSRLELGDKSCKELEKSWLHLERPSLPSYTHIPNLKVNYDGPLVIRANIKESINDDYFKTRNSKQYP